MDQEVGGSSPPSCTTTPAAAAFAASAKLMPQVCSALRVRRFVANQLRVVTGREQGSRRRNPDTDSELAPDSTQDTGRHFAGLVWYQLRQILFIVPALFTGVDVAKTMQH